MQFPVKTGDRILLEVWSTKACSLFLSGWIRKRKGIPEYFSRPVDIAGSASAALESTYHSLVSEGELQYLAVSCSTAFVSPGECFAQVSLQGQENGAAVPICSGYVGRSASIAFPYTGLQSSLSGPGAKQLLTPSNPSAGASYSWTVPDNLAVELIALQFIYTCDANVATRTIYGELRHAGGILVHQTVFGTLTATGSNTFAWLRKALAGGNWAIESGPLTARVTTDNVFYLAAVNVQAGDQISNIRITYRQWVNV